MNGTQPAADARIATWRSGIGLDRGMRSRVRSRVFRLRISIFSRGT